VSRGLTLPDGMIWRAGAYYSRTLTRNIQPVKDLPIKEARYSVLTYLFQRWVI